MENGHFISIAIELSRNKSLCDMARLLPMPSLSVPTCCTDANFRSGNTPARSTVVPAARVARSQTMVRWQQRSLLHVTMQSSHLGKDRGPVGLALLKEMHTLGYHCTNTIVPRRAWRRGNIQSVGLTRVRLLELLRSTRAATRPADRFRRGHVSQPSTRCCKFTYQTV